MRIRRRLTLLTLLLLPLSAHAQQDDLKAMRKSYGKVQPSVVGLRNDECWGTGIILDEKGLILTNAHVLVSPLPFRAHVETWVDGELKEVVFKQIEVLGIHPRFDMALLRINPKEHGVRLTPITISTKKGSTGNPAFAVGYPWSTGFTKTFSPGSITGTDRNYDGEAYYEAEAVIQSGNSGGPLCNVDGELIGVVTLAAEEDYLGLAIPMDDFRPDRFIEWSRRGKNPANMNRLLRVADKLVKLAGSGRAGAAEIAVKLYHRAIVDDVGNPETFFTIGMLYRNTRKFPLAAAYLVRSLQLQPWPDAKADVYHELGVALAELGKAEEAHLVWKEGIAKYPADSGRVWDDLAIYWSMSRNFGEAAYASRMAGKTWAHRGQKMNEIYKNARAQLTPEETNRLQERENGIDAELDSLKRISEKALGEGKSFLSAECDRLIRTYDGVQSESKNVDFSRLGSGAAPSGAPMSDDEVTKQFILARINVAHEFMGSGNRERARTILEDVVKSFPKHPETAAARALLEKWKN